MRKTVEESGLLFSYVDVAEPVRLGQRLMHAAYNADREIYHTCKQIGTASYNNMLRQNRL